MTEDASPALPTRFQLWMKFYFSTGYLLIVTVALSFGTNLSLGWALLIVGCAAVLMIVVALAWTSRWALAQDFRPNQFRLRSLFLLTGAAALYFATIRLLMNAMHSTPENALSVFLEINVFGLLWAFLSLKPLLALAECLVWTSAWLVRLPAVQRLLSQRKR